MSESQPQPESESSSAPAPSIGDHAASGNTVTHPEPVVESAGSPVLAAPAWNSGNELSSVGAWVCWVVAATWVVRFCLLCLPEPLSYDENSAHYASMYSNCQRFWATHDWSERWNIVAAYGAGAKIFWALGHVLWGKIFPAYNGVSASSLTMVFAVIAMVALAGAARNLAGRRGWLLALLITTLSPLFTNYAIRNLGTMQSVTWLCLSLFFFTSYLPSWLCWIAGGLGFGMAFGAHYGTGIPILAVGVSLIPGIPYKLFSKKCGLRGWAKFREVLIYPALGVLFAALPLLLLEAWARYSGESYLGRVTHHENLVMDKPLGPHGLWLRYMFELDPLIPVLLLGLLVSMIQTKNLAIWRKLALFLPFAGIGVILWLAFSEFSLRAAISIGLCAVLGGVIAPFYFSSSLPSINPGPGNGCDPEKPRRIPALGPTGLYFGVALLMGLFTYGREVSGMGRLLFTGWPMLILALVCLLARCANAPLLRLTKILTCIGAIFFLFAMTVLIQAKTIATRAGEFRRWNGELKEYRWDLFLHPHEYVAIKDRLNNDIIVVGQSSWLWPASAYEEEYFKIKEMKEVMRAQGFVKQAEYAEFLIQTNTYFRMKPTQDGPSTVPPQIRNEVTVVEGRDIHGKPHIPYVHPWRGLHLFIPGGEHKEDAEVSAVLEVPAQPGDDVFGCSTLLMAGTPPKEAQLYMILESEDVKRERLMQIVNMRPNMHAVDGDDLKNLQLPLPAKSSPQRVKITARLKGVPDVKMPPISLYVAAPYFIRVNKSESEELMFVGSDKFMNSYASFLPTNHPLMFTRGQVGENLVGVEWMTGPPDPNAPGVYYFAGSFEFAPTCRLSIQGMDYSIQFSLQPQDQQFTDGPITLTYKHLASKEGHHGIFTLRLDPAVIAPRPSFGFVVKVVGGENPSAWFGLRDVANPRQYLNQP